MAGLLIQQMVHDAVIVLRQQYRCNEKRHQESSQLRKPPHILHGLRQHPRQNIFLQRIQSLLQSAADRIFQIGSVHTNDLSHAAA